MPVAQLGKDRPRNSHEVMGNFLNRLGSSRIIGVDVETPSLEDTSLIGAGFAFSPNESYWFDADHPMFPWYVLSDPKWVKVFHNSKFDLESLREYNPAPLNNVVDSCTLAGVLGLPPKLSSLCLKLFGREERLITDILPKGKTMLDLPRETVAERACLDAQDALEAWWYMIGNYYVPAEALNLELEFLPAAMDIEDRGIRLDLEAVDRHHRELNGKLQMLRARAQRAYGFNPGSTNQIAAFMRFVWGEEAAKKLVPMNRRTGKPKLNKEVIESILELLTTTQWNKAYRVVEVTKEALNLVLDYRSTQSLGGLFKRLNKREYVVGDRIHPNMNMDVARSGRISRSRPATQNINYQYRDIVIPEDGEELLVWDFSQIELRDAADQWQDTAMLQAFSTGQDIHTTTAKRIEDLGYGQYLGDTKKEMRDSGKMLNFLMTYQGTGMSVAAKTGLPIDIGNLLVEAYWQSYPGLRSGADEVIKRLHRDGYTSTRLGRRRNFEDFLESGKPYLIRKAEREGVNHEIQGSCAEIMKKALIECYKAGYPTIHTVHDEAEWSSPIGASFEYLPNPVAPFYAPIDVERGPNWRDIK